jgi:hypothetical protein
MATFGVVTKSFALRVLTIIVRSSDGNLASPDRLQDWTVAGMNRLSVRLVVGLLSTLRLEISRDRGPCLIGGILRPESRIRSLGSLDPQIGELTSDR